MILKRVLNSISVFLLIAVSGIPFFMWQLPWVLVGFMISVVSFLLYTDRKLNGKVMAFVGAVFLIQIFQGLNDGQLYWSTYFGYIIRILWAYLVIKTTKAIFIRNYIKILYFFAKVSLVFFAGMVIIPNSKEVFTKISAPFATSVFKLEDTNSQTFHVIIYNFHGYRYAETYNEGRAMLRNCGPFWEPGAFIGFLIIALFFLYLTEGTIKNKKGAVFIIAIITTFSTTGYLALLMCLPILLRKEFNRFRIAIVPLFLILIYVSFFQLDFLSNKIAYESKRNDDDRSRFGAAIRDLQFFTQRPVVGYGRSSQSEYGMAIAEGIASNGVTTMLATMGSVFFIFYGVLIIYSFYRLGKMYNRQRMPYFYAVYMLMSFSEVYYSLPFFIGIAFYFLLTQTQIIKQVKRPLYPTAQLAVS